MDSKTGDKVQYAFRLPRFPVIYAVGNELLTAPSASVLQRQLEHLGPLDATVLDLVDATGEGWAFHVSLRVVSPMTLKKRWKKIDVVRLFNGSNNAQRIGVGYAEANIPRRPLVRIIVEVAALVARGTPKKALQRTVTDDALPGRRVPATDHPRTNG